MLSCCDAVCISRMTDDPEQLLLRVSATPARPFARWTLPGTCFWAAHLRGEQEPRSWRRFLLQPGSPTQTSPGVGHESRHFEPGCLLLGELAAGSASMAAQGENSLEQTSSAPSPRPQGLMFRFSRLSSCFPTSSRGCGDSGAARWEAGLPSAELGWGWFQAALEPDRRREEQ